MQRTVFPLTLLASAVLLAGCGGAGDDVALARAEQARPDKRAQALAVVGAKELFDWAQFKFPDLLGGLAIDFPAPIPHEGKTFIVRYVPGKNAYMGLDSTGQVYALAPFTNDVLKPYGPLSSFELQVQADSCNVYPGSCGGPPGPGALLFWDQLQATWDNVNWQ